KIVVRANGIISMVVVTILVREQPIIGLLHELIVAHVVETWLCQQEDRGLGTNKIYTVHGVEPSYTNWLPGEPNDSGGIEDCVELVYKSRFWKNGGDVGGQWNDLPCNGYPRHFVCQMSSQS
ncbi:signal peptide, CUB and EGF-like domain-containing 2, partial [Paramuricea clavata]